MGEIATGDLFIGSILKVQLQVCTYNNEWLLIITRIYSFSITTANYHLLFLVCATEFCLSFTQNMFTLSV